MTTEQLKEYCILRDELHNYCMENERRGKGCKGCLLEHAQACSDCYPRLSTIKRAVELIRKERAVNA
jgi:hypothetical protein